MTSVTFNMTVNNFNFIPIVEKHDDLLTIFQYYCTFLRGHINKIFKSSKTYEVLCLLVVAYLALTRYIGCKYGEEFIIRVLWGSFYCSVLYFLVIVECYV